MYAWFYRDSVLVTFPLIATFIFLTVFVAVIIRTYLRSQRPSQDAAAALPLQDDDGDDHALFIPRTEPTGARHGN